MPQTSRYATGSDLPGEGLSLSAEHRRELFIDSVIDPEVARERGYTTVERIEYPQPSRERMAALGFPSWAIREPYYFPGLHIPQYTPSGQRYAGQFKPSRPVPARDGKKQRYASAKGASRLDVHPRWSVLAEGLLPPILDPERRLWITEGVKKADALTSRGEVTVALAGVYNWRNTHATLGDWEDIQLKGREVVVCFDADAITKPHVAQAMARLGKWLTHKGARKVHYLTVPPAVGDAATKGVDDYFAAGGSLKELERAFTARPPQVVDTEDRFTDARLAETLAHEVLEGDYVWCAGLGWLASNRVVWREATEVTATETVRQWALQRFGDAAARLKLDDKAAGAEVDGWKTMLSASRAKAVLGLARGLVERQAEDFDADTTSLNTASGYLDLDTGTVRAIGEDEYPTKVTNARFDPGARSALWTGFVERILPDEAVRAFVQRLLGYALLGEVREHVMPIFIGEGANGKGTLRDAVVKALGSYAIEVDPEILMVTHNPQHKTFLMELRGRRVVFCSETQKGRRFNDAQMRRLVGGDPIQANKMRQDPITFDPTHTLIMCSNHLPAVDDDAANWRRLLVVPFDVIIPEEERDGRLPRRLQSAECQAAILAWMYAGYLAYVEQGLNPPEAVRVRTATYRSENDLVGRFLDDMVSRGDGSATLPEVVAAYVAWWRTEGPRDVQPLSGRELSKVLGARGWVSRKSNGKTVYAGMVLGTA